ncbi:ABC transporter, ATP-binding protein (cluster 5, nickel/peptides/opines) / ABC transporter, ATP-binding protein (cluster 5, nickel/peptides/opines) [hydrothermal vent metagenome]|uniref:ABC transporter, ATP-binding protein (Cluster 5, nickel/peptides/opines) / ABC transporter, ATP-binding protein (Cluster 5, nickel/peptides/opines) n=1 Tax=hydrothermal vent metagenome TaxID=652676 RepID=A0A3B1ABH1_9ZZZZ
MVYRGHSRTTGALLQIESLQTSFATVDGMVHAVDGISLEIRRGQTFALLGESGCGKSMTALSIMRLLPEPAGRITQGSIYLNGDDLLQLSETAMRNVRGKRIAMIFQEPMSSLNPVLTVGLQIAESIRGQNNAQAVRARVLELLEAVGIPDPVQRYHEYPHQLSGGMKQRVMIAIALAGEPDLLIADEPTTALDVTIQAQVLNLMRQLQKDTGMAILLITHDLGVVSEMADRVAVMYAGQIVEEADRAAFFANPQHPYSKKLFASLPDIKKRGQRLEIIPGSVPSLATGFSGCRFVDRCDDAIDVCHVQPPAWITTASPEGVRCFKFDATYQQEFSIADKKETVPDRGAEQSTKSNKALLTVHGLKVHFPIRKGVLQRVVNHVKAVDDISLSIPEGHTLALVGESGCGKTTAGKSILQLVKPTAGKVQFANAELTALSSAQLRQHRSDIQIIFQDPFSSMNPRMKVMDIIEEGMITQGIGGDAQARAARVDQLLEQVGLSADSKDRYPHEFSGGQRQRICIARALAVDPKLIICDEPTSALDVSVQAQILNLLKDLQDELGLAYLFITHDLSVVEYLAHEVAVMYLGRIVEQGDVQEVMENPLHPYTKALLAAVPVIEKSVESVERSIVSVQGEMPSPINPPSGCHFHPRCTQSMPECKQDYPGPRFLSEGHMARCFLYE